MINIEVRTVDKEERYFVFPTKVQALPRIREKMLGTVSGTGISRTIVGIYHGEDKITILVKK